MHPFVLVLDAGALVWRLVAVIVVCRTFNPISDMHWGDMSEYVPWSHLWQSQT